MSNYDAFDDNIKDQFRDYNPPVHPRIWENIIKERKKRKPVGFWVNFLNGRNILILAALIVASSTGAYLLLKKDTTPNNRTATVTGKQQNKPTIAPGNGEKNATNNQQLTSSSTSQPNNSDFDIIANATNSGTKINTGAGSSLKIKTHAAFAEAGGSENEAWPVSKPNKKSTAGSEYEEDFTGQQVLYGKTNRDNFLKHLLFTQLETVTTAKKPLHLAKRNLPNVFLPDCPSIEDNAAGNKSYIEIYGGPDLGFRTMSDTGNSAYLQKRKESTKFSSAYSAGLRYTRVFGNGMSMRTGINYSQINEKFTFVQGNLVQVTYIINAAGDTTGSYITTGTRYKTTHNKFKTIDVPLLIGYEMGNGKFHANVNAGIIVNAYSWQKGEVLDTAYNPVSITTGKTTSPYQFKTNIGLGFTAGVSMYYKLNDKLHVVAEPYFRYNLSPMSKEKLTLTQKYNTAGLRLGLRLDLQ
jgi:hypothetical protein